MIEPTSSSDFRQIIVDTLRKDIIGPDRDSSWAPILDETLTIDGGGSPQRQYITGFLEPRNWNDGEDNLEAGMVHGGGSNEPNNPEIRGSQVTSENPDDPRNSEPEVSGRTIENPSSMGISFVVGNQHLDEDLELTAEWGQYQGSQENEIWKRRQVSEKISHTPRELLSNGTTSTDVNGSGIFIESRTKDIGDSVHITFRLVNRRASPDPSKILERGESAIFQTRIAISCSGIEDARISTDLASDPTTELLYHKSKTLARGHNVSVDWDEDRIWTEWIPDFEVRRSEEDASLSKHVPETECLADPERIGGSLDQLSGLIVEYSRWASEIRKWKDGEGPGTLNEKLIDRLGDHLEAIEENISRMKGGVSLLRSSQTASQAFMYANGAVLRSQQCPAVGRDNFKWKPFQISFIILNLTGLLHQEEGGSTEHRSIIDLAWFPTGGGKTEAYLGLVAVLGFYRHLKGVDQTPSVQAIMRYTLRLLTLQQGERATRLVAAMNIVSRENDLDCAEFSVGMWVGAGTSPNSLQDARRINDKVRTTNEPPKKENPMLLERCPWCDHSPAEPRDRAAQWAIRDDGRFRGVCARDGCELNERYIPFSCNDEDIYQHPPTFLIGTIDKFARLASEPRSRVLLGMKSGDVKRSPPDLVIQDELHLLTGPLGSLHGLFEATIEVLWQRMGHTAKYVAATATIRGADRDSKLMYGRDLNVFPPPGLTIDDNFFSKYTSDSPGRQHLAILGNKANSRTILDMPLANLLQVPFGLKRKFPDMARWIEPYMTAVVYFNSRRELAGALSHLEDTVIPEWIPGYALRNDQEERIVHGEKVEELYSRKKPEDLKRTLSNLKIESDEVDSLDACFTTNMFQVGVDVNRLGLMIINGQPKSNSEYIQASGRVGRVREWPGLIVSTLRAGKPRDLSHFEMHRSFHQEMYRHVDITTTTPFSPRAIDRAVNTILMLLIRQGVEGCSEDDQIVSLNELDSKNRAEDLIGSLVEIINSRVNDHKIRAVVEGKIWGSFNELTTWVRRQSEEGFTLSWREKGTAAPGRKGWGQGGFTKNPNLHVIMDSMRDVGDEVWFGRKGQRAFGKMPMGDLFSHSRPGGLWDHEGWGLMTLGLNKWDVEPHQMRRLQIEEQVLSTLVPGYGIMRPPTNSEDGQMSVDDFPQRVVCTSNPAHVSYPTRENNERICGHEGCGAKVRQSRFVSLCSAGHLEEFDWNRWIEHESGCSKRRSSGFSHIRIDIGAGSRFNLAGFNVRCTECGGSRTLRGVTSTKLKNCNSYSPWITFSGNGDACMIGGEREQLSTRRRDSSSIVLPDYGTAMLIHPQVNWHMLSNNLVQAMIKLDPEKNQTELDTLFDLIKKDGSLEDTVYNLSNVGKTGYDKSSFMDDLNYQRTKPKQVNQGNIRMMEFDGMAHGRRKEVDDGKHYLSFTEFGGEVTSSGVWNSEGWPISHLSRLERLTELKYLTEISRLDGHASQDIGVFPDKNWGIGDYNYGEGIFIGLHSDWVEERADSRGASLGENVIRSGVESINRFTIAQELDLTNMHIAKSLPIVHTLSHLVIKELCWEAGYSIGSIRERLYLKADKGGLTKAGFLLYTTGQSSDGTLGGLASQGTRDVIERVMKRSLERLDECSNDPICGENRPDAHSESGASCHACVQLPETCCEIGNRLLDRIWE